MRSGRPAIARLRVAVRGEVIELDLDVFLSLAQTDAELGDIMLRAFILRRVEMITQGVGDVHLLGSNHSAGTLRVKEFLTRNGHTYAFDPPCPKTKKPEPRLEARLLVEAAGVICGALRASSTVSSVS